MSAVKVIESTGDSCRDTHSMTPIHFTEMKGCEYVSEREREREREKGMLTEC